MTKVLLGLVGSVAWIALLGCAVWGGPDALAAMFGRATGNHFAFAVVALFAWASGWITRHISVENPGWKKSYSLFAPLRLAATCVFLATFVYLNRESFETWSTTVDMLFKAFASFVVWFTVVLLPWGSLDIAKDHDK